MDANLLSPTCIRLFVSSVMAKIIGGRHDPVFAAYSTASMLVRVLYFCAMRAVALAPAGPGRQRRRATVVALAVALTSLVQLLVYRAADPRSMALATWAVNAVFLVAFASPRVA
uniref:Uncharacterized protein n=1 Tax=Leersia perrieri TaxID=77586 RepID=A0A0D9WEB0_9ORYZ